MSSSDAYDLRCVLVYHLLDDGLKAPEFGNFRRIPRKNGSGLEFESHRK